MLHYNIIFIFYIILLYSIIILLLLFFVVVIIILLLIAAPCRSKRPRLGGHIDMTMEYDPSNVFANGLLHGIGEPNAGINVFHLFYSMSSKFLRKQIIVGIMMSE